LQALIRKPPFGQTIKKKLKVKRNKEISPLNKLLKKQKEKIKRRKDNESAISVIY
jgi:hypothetical protein